MNRPVIDSEQACLQAWQIQHVLRALYAVLPEDARGAQVAIKPIIDVAANLAGNLSLHLSTEGDIALLTGESP